jgi:XrtJ-associated TM-motif-TM protein
MKKFAYIIPVALFMLLATPQIVAQIGGCEDSPENPTAVLGLIVSAVGIGYVRLRNHIGSRRK